MSLNHSILIFTIGLFMAGPALGQSTEPSSAAKPISPETIALSADFEGQLDRTVNTAYFCKGISKFIAAPNAENSDNKALLLTLNPGKSTSLGRCEPTNARTERTELAEPDDLRLPLGTEAWYGFRFMVPSAMKGKFAGQRLVIAQLKQHPNTCPLGPQPIGLPADAGGNPTISLRVIEDAGDTMGLQLAVAGDNSRKVSVGQLMQPRDQFLDRWHDVLLHAKVMPAGNVVGNSGYVEGWLDGKPFTTDLYGVMDDKATFDPSEPFGYSGLVGCTYFKYGIYRDSQSEPWSIAFDRFRRGATRESVESPAP